MEKNLWAKLPIAERSMTQLVQFVWSTTISKTEWVSCHYRHHQKSLNLNAAIGFITNASKNGFNIKTLMNAPSVEESLYNYISNFQLINSTKNKVFLLKIEIVSLLIQEWFWPMKCSSLNCICAVLDCRCRSRFVCLLLSCGFSSLLQFSRIVFAREVSLFQMWKVCLIFTK